MTNYTKIKLRILKFCNNYNNLTLNEKLMGDYSMEDSLKTIRILRIGRLLNERNR